MATRVGPTLTLVASCLDCDHLRFDFDVYRCAHPKASSVAEPMICSAHREPRAPAWCPELPGARLALAREIVAGAGGAPRPPTYDDQYREWMRQNDPNRQGQP